MKFLRFGILVLMVVISTDARAALKSMPWGIEWSPSFCSALNTDFLPLQKNERHLKSISTAYEATVSEKSIIFSDRSLSMIGEGTRIIIEFKEDLPFQSEELLENIFRRAHSAKISHPRLRKDSQLSAWASLERAKTKNIYEVRLPAEETFLSIDRKPSLSFADFAFYAERLDPLQAADEIFGRNWRSTTKIGPRGWVSRGCQSVARLAGFKSVH